jgi:microcystin-dependent protein
MSIAILSALDRAITIAEGGTGATTPAGARDNLGVTLPGEMKMFGGASTPTGWAICDGSALSRTTYAALFAAIGTNHGTGDGSTTFNIPDLRGRFALGADGSHALGVSGGAASITISTSNLPSHSHVGSINGSDLGATTDISVGQATTGGTAIADTGSRLTSTLAAPNAGSAAIYLPNGTAQTTPVILGGVETHITGTAGFTTSSVGSGAAITTVPPFLAINFIIKL